MTTNCCSKQENSFFCRECGRVLGEFNLLPIEDIFKEPIYLTKGNEKIPIIGLKIKNSAEKNFLKVKFEINFNVGSKDLSILAYDKNNNEILCDNEGFYPINPDSEFNINLSLKASSLIKPNLSELKGQILIYTPEKVTRTGKDLWNRFCEVRTINLVRPIVKEWVYSNLLEVPQWDFRLTDRGVQEIGFIKVGNLLKDRSINILIKSKNKYAIPFSLDGSEEAVLKDNEQTLLANLPPATYRKFGLRVTVNDDSLEENVTPEIDKGIRANIEFGASIEGTYVLATSESSVVINYDEKSYASSGSVVVVDFGTAYSKVAGFIQKKEPESLVLREEFDEDDFRRYLISSAVSIFPSGEIVPFDQTKRENAILLRGIKTHLRKIAIEPSEADEKEEEKKQVRRVVKTFIDTLYYKVCELNRVGDILEKRRGKLILTIPVDEVSYQKELEAIASEMGFVDIEIIEEPIAAAYYFLRAKQEYISDAFRDKYYMVFDCGAGTTDIAVLKPHFVQKETRTNDVYVKRDLICLKKTRVNIASNEIDKSILGKIKEIYYKSLKSSADSDSTTTFRQVRVLRDLNTKILEDREHQPLNKAIRDNMKAVCDIDVSPEMLEEINQVIRDKVKEILEIADKVINFKDYFTKIAKIFLVGGGCVYPPVKEELENYFFPIKTKMEKLQIMFTCVSLGAIYRDWEKPMCVSSKRYTIKASGQDLVIDPNIPYGDDLRLLVSMRIPTAGSYMWDVYRDNERINRLHFRTKKDEENIEIHYGISEQSNLLLRAVTESGYYYL